MANTIIRTFIRPRLDLATLHQIWRTRNAHPTGNYGVGELFLERLAWVRRTKSVTQWILHGLPVVEGTPGAASWEAIVDEFEITCEFTPFNHSYELPVTAIITESGEVVQAVYRTLPVDYPPLADWSVVGIGV